MAPKRGKSSKPGKGGTGKAKAKDRKDDGDGPAEPAAAAASAPKNKEEVLAQVNLDGLPHCPTEQILELLREKYDTLVAVFIHYCKQSECKTLEQATRLRLRAPSRSPQPAGRAVAMRRVGRGHDLRQRPRGAISRSQLAIPTTCRALSHVYARARGPCLQPASRS